MTLDWEAWLRGRYAAYLLNAASGEPRDHAAVAEALSRLTHQQGTLTRLAAIHFLLDPERGPQRLLLHELPRYLPRVHPTSHREIITRRGSPPGRVSWPRTFALRQQAGDPTLFVGSTARRSFDTPALRLIRWLLQAVQSALQDVERFARSTARSGWTAGLPPLAGAAAEFLKHAALRDLRADPLTPNERAHIAHSPYEAVNAAVQLADFHDTIRPTPRTPEALAAVIGRHALTPDGAPRRFELFGLLALLAAVTRVWPTAVRRDSLIEPGRTHVAEWLRGASRLRLYYDNKAPDSLHYGAVCRHYLGSAQPLRPDLRLELRGPDDAHRELYLDTKLSERDKDVYYRRGLLELIGKTADRPSTFAGNDLRGVLICGSHVIRDPLPTHAFALVGPDACTHPDGPLDALIRRWLSPCSDAG